ncbi:hypothetical protein [Aurantibacter aestuarii]|uniref:Uncharacterized protein n=1 Tax=Aurantibacter aestuarii TaxID=1266046 RepID=A0A2T1NEL8_9FLAO|nr:hypothetical protein [Aurantibacter aestuarii]PSG90887.1 hypothetical protein C7H52_06330 [Aurantibacter aestuarii]
MSDNTNKPKDVPFAPSRTELYDLYTGVSKTQINKSFKYVRKKFPIKSGNPKSLTNPQFVNFIIELGIPHGYKKSDFPFLDNVPIKLID